MKNVLRLLGATAIALGAFGLISPANAAPIEPELTPATVESSAPAQEASPPGVAATSAPAPAPSEAADYATPTTSEPASIPAAPVPGLADAVTYASDAGGVGSRAACSYSGGHPQLYQGITGQSAAVSHLQCLLKYFHNETWLIIDGVFGADTKAAVRNFQSNHGLVVDGWIGAIGWKHLHPDTDAGLH